MEQQALIGRPRNDYPPDFEAVWDEYPRRGRTKGANDNKIAACRQYHKRLREGCCPRQILEGVRQYAAHCEAHGIAGTMFVKQAATFLGPDRHFETTWEVETDPRREPWAKVPTADDDLWDWAKEHGYPNPGSRDFRQYRRFLWECVEKRLEEVRGNGEA